MLFFWKNKKPKPSAIAPISQLHEPPLAQEEACDILDRISHYAYETFLHGYASTMYDEAEQQRVLKTNLCTVTADVTSKLLRLAQIEDNTQQEAERIVQQAQQRAVRHIEELRTLCDEVLIDERNHLLAAYINQEANTMGLGKHSPPFSGINTDRGAPHQAFAYKLCSDCALQRNIAANLTYELIQQLAADTATQAQQDIDEFLQRYHEEDVPA